MHRVACLGPTLLLRVLLTLTAAVSHAQETQVATGATPTPTATPVPPTVPFGSLSVITTLANSALSVFGADVDGDLDVLSASVSDDMIAWYANKGGQFALTTTATSPGSLADGGSQQESTR